MSLTEKALKAKHRVAAVRRSGGPITIMKSLFPERLANEPSGAYQKFLTFCELGGNRTIAQVAREFGKDHASVSKTSKRWRWHERCAAYDLKLAEENANRQRAQMREAAELRHRNELRRQRESFEIAQELLAKARLMLSVIKTKEVVAKDGTSRTYIHGAGYGTIAAMLLREYNRLAVNAGRDVVLLDDFRMGIADDGIHSGRKIAGQFSVGDKLYEQPKDQPAVVDQAPPELPPLEDQAPDLGVHLDLEGLGDLYETRE